MEIRIKITIKIKSRHPLNTLKIQFPYTVKLAGRCGRDFIVIALVLSKAAIVLERSGASEPSPDREGGGL